MYIGKKENPTTVLILTIVTCGIYGIVYLYNVLSDLNKITGKELVNPILGAILAPWGWYVVDKEFQTLYPQEGLGEYKSNFILWIVLCLCYIGAYISIYQICVGMNKIWDNRQGKGTPGDTAAQ